MLPVQNLMRRGFKVLRIGAIACRNPISPSPVSLIHHDKLGCYRNVNTGVTTRWVTAQNVQAEKSENETKISGVSMLSSEWMLEVKWNDGSSDRYPYLWLRDNCQCPVCFHPTAHARTVDIKELDVAIAPASVNLIENSSAFEITWPNGHRSIYGSEWLKDRSFASDKRERRRRIRSFDKELWASDSLPEIPKVKYDDLRSDEKVLLDFILTLERIGLVVVSGAPRRVGGLKELTDHLGYWKWSHYGSTFAVKTRVDPINLAYTSGDLLLHTDLPYCQTKPEIQLLHCIEQTSCQGGENVLVDSFSVAEQLRDRYPEKFDILSTTPIDFIDIGNEEKLKRFFVLSQHPLIQVDRNGKISAVSSSHMGRDSHFSAPIEKVREWYDAMLTFYGLLYRPENTVMYKMEDGDILIFDNSRIMHGRNGFRMTEGTRELEGCYWDWDMVRSCRRVLQMKHGLINPSHQLGTRNQDYHRELLAWCCYSQISPGVLAANALSCCCYSQTSSGVLAANALSSCCYPQDFCPDCYLTQLSLLSAPVLQLTLVQFPTKATFTPLNNFKKRLMVCCQLANKINIVYTTEAIATDSNDNSGMSVIISTIIRVAVLSLSLPLSQPLQTRHPGHRTINTGCQTGGVGQKVDPTLHQTGKDSGRIVETSFLNDDWMLEIQWEDGFKTKYPYIWLRDNCQCPKCFHRTTFSRRILISELDISIVPDKFKLSEDSNLLEVSWSDGHVGVYSSEWLRDRSFSEDTREMRHQLRGSPRTLWGSTILENLPRANFQHILQEDEALLECLIKLESLGLVIVQDAPLSQESAFELAQRLGYFRETHYGITFSVKNKVEPNNLAYTSDSLNVHTDLPFFDYQPGVQLLHCISQAPCTGGDNRLVDGFSVARKLQDLDPKKFDVLSTVPVDFIDHGLGEDGKPFFVLAQHPMIRLNPQGDIVSISVNQMVRDSFFNIPVEMVRVWYDSMLTYYEMLGHPDNAISYKMKEGDMIIFDNQRVLHGRKGFQMTEGTRELHGCYFDWDMVKSCRRVLQRKLGMLKT
ncbi:uncharacterized protein [Palaemon carinicauda]|uniref:uncharacterized protein n=1 Tax=Palaemon carinicauda TaxID=392227 RepID=UPI0035B5ACB8